MQTWLHDSSHAYPEREIPILSTATVTVTSEAEGQPITRVFDDVRGPGAPQWVAGQPGDQVLTIAFHEPRQLGQITLEVEERDVSRTQEVAVAVSTDGGRSYREIRRQEFNFSPDGATWESESWRVSEQHVTHLKLLIRPDKGRKDQYAKLTSFLLAEA